MSDVQVTINKKDLEKHREIWAKAAIDKGWYTEPFHVQVWVHKDGEIQDSVSFRGLKADIFVLVEPSKDGEWASIGGVDEVGTIQPTISEDI